MRVVMDVWRLIASSHVAVRLCLRLNARESHDFSALSPGLRAPLDVHLVLRGLRFHRSRMEQRGAQEESCERSNGDLIKRVCGHGFLSVSEGGRLGTSNKRMCVFGRFEGVLP